MVTLFKEAGQPGLSDDLHFQHDSASQLLTTAADEPYPTASMFAINRRQLYQIARRRGDLGWIRGNASQAGEMAVKSPREVCRPIPDDRRS